MDRKDDILCDIGHSGPADPNPTPSRRDLLGMVAGSTFALSLSSPTKAQGIAVDLILLLAIDCSFSVSRSEYNLQTQGMALAFLDPEIVEAILSGPYARIAVGVMQWSSEASQPMVIPWTLLDSPTAIIHFSAELSVMRRQTADGATALGDALTRAGDFVQSAPYDSVRKVIDVSGDGRKNTGTPVRPIRDALIRRGITINGLVIRNEDPNLDIYYNENVVGGIGSFTVVTYNYKGYGDAIRKKLLREIRFSPVSERPDTAAPNATI